MKFTEQAYRERLDALFVRFPSVQKSGFTTGAYKEGLQGMERFDEALGHPHRQYRTVHVAGTNGKGSVSSMLAADLAALGMKVGLYTSPHLLDFRERIKIIFRESGSDEPGFTMISEEDVWEFLEAYDDRMDGLSFFEITTGMGLWWFARQKVDIAVIEVGLGGRLDSTNVITPEVSVVTSIGLDHCALLGNTRAAIAAEKAGIFKHGRPAVVWGHDCDTDPVFAQTAARTGSVLHFAGEATDLPDTDLQGDYQRLNLATVSKVLDVLGLPLVREAVVHTARITGLRGRWEILQNKPLAICDIGHNPAALELNFRQLENYGRPLVVVYGVMADKDLKSIVPLMSARAHYIFCAPDTPRALDVGELAATVRAMRPELDTENAGSVEDAVKKACETAGPDSIIYIGGSTFVVCEAVPLFR